MGYNDIHTSFEGPRDVEGMPKEILSYLAQRPDQWFTADKIAKELGVKKTRTQERVRLSIKQLQFRGQPIISGAKGFCFTFNDHRIRRYINELIQRKKGLERSISAMERIVDGKELVSEVQIYPY